MAPNKEYLLLLDQPAIRIPITPIEETAETYNTPMFRSHICNPGAKEKGANARKLTTKTIKGANPKRNLSAPFGVRHSLSNSFSTSANACMDPQNPTLIGPKRNCIKPATLRSI